MQKSRVPSVFSAVFGGGSSSRIAQNSKAGVANSGASMVSAGTYVEGEVHFSGDLLFAGKLKGVVQAPNGGFELSESGEVHGSVTCEVFHCCGQVVGEVQISGQSVLRSGCRLVGDIVTKELAIQSGVRINANCKMLEEHPDMDFFSMSLDSLRGHLKS